MENRADKKNIRTYGGVIFAPLIVFCLYFLQLAVTGVFPFVKGYTVASYDLSAQICPFIEHLFDVLDGKSSLFYSYSVAGGADVFGTLAYFFISPFSFLFLLFGDGRSYNAAGVVMAFKLAAIACSGAFAAGKLCKSVPQYVLAALGVVYAYCGYTFVSNTYINWTDFLIYAPLAVVAFLRMKRTGNFTAFSLCLTACVYTCFSIACFSFLTVYPVLVLYGLLCKQKGERGRSIARISLSFVLAVLLSLPILLPALSAYLHSGRGVGLFENVWFGFTENGFDKKAFLDRSATAWFRKFSYIFSDAAFVLLTLSWFIKTGLKTPFAKFMLFAGVYTLVPVLSDESMNLLNMGSYMSYALRFGFLNATYFFGGACLALEEIFARKRSPQIAEEKRKGIPPIGVVFLLAAAMIAFILSGAYIGVWELVLTDSEMIAETKNFAGLYAHSLGGLHVIAVLFLLVAAAFVVLSAGLKKGTIGLKTASWLLIGLVSVQIVFYNEQLVLGNRSEHTSGLHYERMAQMIEDGEYYRIKDYGDLLTANEPLTSNTASFSAFSSLIDKDNFATQILFGYSGNGKNTLKSAGGNRFGDALLGYKYIFVSKEQKTYVSGLSDMKEATVGGTAVTSGNFHLYENEIVFPMGYTVANGNFTFPKENTFANRTENQFALYEYLSGEEVEGSVRSVTTRMTKTLAEKLGERAAQVRVGAGKITASVTAEAGEYLFLPFVASRGYRAYVNGTEKALSENDLNFLCVALDEGENTVEFRYVSPYPKLCLYGFVFGAFGALALYFALKKTKLFERTARGIAVCGVALASLVTAFFFLFPTGVFFVQLVRLIF